jgi:hypothetical protein
LPQVLASKSLAPFYVQLWRWLQKQPLFSSCPSSSHESPPSRGEWNTAFAMCTRSHFLTHCPLNIRFRDAARQFHSRGPKSDVFWSSIKAHRLSSHHGEFCKLFCGQTIRDFEFFTDSGNRSGEQLLNMIDNCSAFFPGMDKYCSVFRELFHVDQGKLGQLSEGLDRMRSAAVGRHSSKSSRLNSDERCIRDIRNKLAHEVFFLQDDNEFEIIVSCSRKFLEAIYSVAGCVVGELDTDTLTKSLSEIERIQKRNIHLSPLSDSERHILHYSEQEESLLQAAAAAAEPDSLRRSALAGKHVVSAPL